jgi:hypothetical protein
MAGVIPGKTHTPGLDFSGQAYASLATKHEADIARAHEIIKEKLPVLGQLNGLISLTFGERAPVFLDARSGGEAKFLEQCSAEPDTKITMKPECKHNVPFSPRHIVLTKEFRYFPVL